MAALCLLAVLASSAQAARPHIGYGGYGIHATGKSPDRKSAKSVGLACNRVVGAKQGLAHAVAVWPPKRWHRKPDGRPKRAAIAAHHRHVRCARGPGHRAAIKRSWETHRAAFYRQRRRCRAGTVVRGRVSYFGGQTMASGLIADETAGLAMNIAPGTDAGWNNPTTRAWVRDRQRFWVGIPGYGHRAIEPVVDLGPAGWVYRAIDFTVLAVYDLGLSPGSFPTDAVGWAKLIPDGCL